MRETLQNKRLTKIKFQCLHKTYSLWAERHALFALSIQ